MSAKNLWKRPPVRLANEADVASTAQIVREFIPVPATPEQNSDDGMTPITFETINPTSLDQGDSVFLDSLSFGVIGFSDSRIVEIYNATEASYARLRPETVLGQHLFLTVAVCMNNFMVAQRYDDEAQIDTVIDYVLTFRMRPTPVRMRLIKHPELRYNYLLIQRPIK
jgi:photoactive yellow protein